MAWDVITGAALNAANLTVDGALLEKASNLITMFQAIGGLIIAYLVFNLINLWHARKRRKDIEKMMKILEKIDKKLNRIKR